MFLKLSRSLELRDENAKQRELHVVSVDDCWTLLDDIKTIAIESSLSFHIAYEQRRERCDHDDIGDWENMQPFAGINAEFDEDVERVSLRLFEFPNCMGPAIEGTHTVFSGRSVIDNHPHHRNRHWWSHPDDEEEDLVYKMRYEGTQDLTLQLDLFDFDDDTGFSVQVLKNLKDQPAAFIEDCFDMTSSYIHNEYHLDELYP